MIPITNYCPIFTLNLIDARDRAKNSKFDDFSERGRKLRVYNLFFEIFVEEILPERQGKRSSGYNIAVGLVTNIPYLLSYS